MKLGSLLLIPTPLADPKTVTVETHTIALASSQPPDVRTRIANLTTFAVENAKAARAFLKANGTATPLQNLTLIEIGRALTDAALAPIIAALKQGIDVGVLAEVGCPGIADPGATLARAAHAISAPVVPLVGASSILLTLMASGLNGQCFAFHGYLPIEAEPRIARIKSLEARSLREKETELFIETPYRNEALCAALVATLKNDTWLTIATDLSLSTETIQTRKIRNWRGSSITYLAKRPSVFAFQA